jgi:hypothetical protein
LGNEAVILSSVGSLPFEFYVSAEKTIKGGLSSRLHAFDCLSVQLDQTADARCCDPEHSQAMLQGLLQVNMNNLGFLRVCGRGCDAVAVAVPDD